jgi:hypothetical protein
MDLSGRPALKNREAPQTLRSVKQYDRKYSLRYSENPSERSVERYREPHLELSRPVRYSRLLLNFVKVLAVLLVLAVAVNFAYDYAQEKVGRREVEIQKLKAIKPLYYEGEPMTREWARKAMKNREYMGHWYECLGEGAVTVFLWFVL